MIIDLICDRQEGKPYNPKKFYNDVLGYDTKSAKIITYCMDYFGETLVQSALCDYIIGNGYNTDLCNYIKSVNWLVSEV